MSKGGEKIRFDLEISRVIDVLAKQIYQSPLALLRENAQNAYDAILLRRYRDPSFDAAIHISIKEDEVRVSDNGVGMSASDLRNHFWRAGSSSKNTPDARAAGVVGTFGIGAMANFGIAGELLITTEDMRTGERILSRASRDTLSVTEECIDVIPQVPTGRPGTEVVAKILPQHRVNVAEATRYIAEFVGFLDIPVFVNQVLVSGRAIEQAVSWPAELWRFQETARNIGPRLRADVQLVLTAAGELGISLEHVEWDGGSLPGRMVLRQGLSALRTYRSAFGLATTSVASNYQFGGVADFLFLEPTAGREALATSSMRVLQSMMSEIDDFCSEQLAARHESDLSTPFMSWVVQRGRYDLCGNLRIRVEPGDSLRLAEVSRRTEISPMRLYSGMDQAVIKQYASEDSPLLLSARSHPRRKCEGEFLRRYCKTQEISDKPKVLETKPAAAWSIGESGVAFRIAVILEADYFLKTQVAFGRISHGLPLLVEKLPEGISIILDAQGPMVSMLCALYERDFAAFGSLAKDFVRNVIFPRVSDLVPSSTRQGAEAFLKTIRKTREVFEYESSDLGDLLSIWQDVVEGRLTIAEATDRSIAAARASVQVFDSSAAAPMTEVVPDVIENEAIMREETPVEEREGFDAAPAITRLDKSSSAKLLLIGEQEQPLRGYRCFLAITDRVREENGSFFLQPHKTSIVWGGQKALFIFEHHSGRFGLYYDLQSADMIAGESGGGPFPTYTIVLRNGIFIPVPEAIRSSFIPGPGERKRFEVRCDILHRGVGDVDVPSSDTLAR